MSKSTLSTSVAQTTRLHLLNSHGKVTTLSNHRRILSAMDLDLDSLHVRNYRSSSATAVEHQRVIRRAAVVAATAAGAIPLGDLAISKTDPWASLGPVNLHKLVRYLITNNEIT